MCKLIDLYQILKSSYYGHLMKKMTKLMKKRKLKRRSSKKRKNKKKRRRERKSMKRIRYS